MDNPSDEKPVFDGPALWSYGFRPFFLGAALFAAFAVPVWILILSAAPATELARAARHWHIHEMIFGFLPAVMAGFLLTALPNWTDRPPMRGMALALLFALWCAGRGVMALRMFVPVPGIVVDSGFLVVLAGIAWRDILSGPSWSRAPIAGLITLYAAANIGSHTLTLTGSHSEAAERMALGLLLILLALIGGRIVPAFTSEWLDQHHGEGETLPSFSTLDGLSLALVAIAAVSWTIVPESGITGWILLAAGCATLGRLSRWRGWRTWEEPLVLILHVGYAWLGLSMVSLGAAVLEAGLSPADAVHALTTGAVGAMTLGVMTRASLGHTGRPRHAGAITVLIYVLVNLGAVLRVGGPSTGLPLDLVFVLAAASWSGAYLLFAMAYGPFLIRPSLDE